MNLAPRLHRCIFCLIGALPAVAQAHSESNTAVWLSALALAVPTALATLYALGIVRLWHHARPGAGIRRREGAAFALGYSLLVIALAPPLDTLAGQLFSAHMVQHELLMLGAAPLLLLGKPLPVWLWALPRPWRRACGNVARSRLLAIPVQACQGPLIAWSQHLLVLWLWHVPALFQAALAHPLLHAVQHLVFLGSAMILWRVVFARRHGLWQAGTGTLTLFTTALHTGILGALLTFAPAPLYRLDANAENLPWLSALEDQQLGGLIMWVPGGFVYIGALLILMSAWLRQIERHRGAVHPALYSRV